MYVGSSMQCALMASGISSERYLGLAFWTIILPQCCLSALLFHTESIILNMDVSENSGFSPQIIHFNWIFHHKPSILGYHYFLETPISFICKMCFFVGPVRQIRRLHHRTAKFLWNKNGFQGKSTYDSQFPIGTSRRGFQV